jgi:hypothetical protein
LQQDAGDQKTREHKKQIDPTPEKTAGEKYQPGGCIVSWDIMPYDDKEDGNSPQTIERLRSFHNIELSHLGMRQIIIL